MVAAIDETSQNFLQFGSNAFAKTLRHGASYPDELNELLDEGIELFSGIASTLVRFLELGDETIFEVQSIDLDMTPSLMATKTLKESQIIADRPDILAKLDRLESVFRAVETKQSELTAKLYRLSEEATEEVLRDFPDILERIKRSEAGESKTIPLEELAAKYGVEV